jgi:hypothetical protein
VIGQIQSDARTGPFPGYAWWTLVYMLGTIIGIFVVIASDTTQTYHVAVVGYLAAGLVLTTSSCNALVYSSNGAREAAAAGFILLSMVQVRSPSPPNEVCCRNEPNTACATDCLGLLLRICTIGGPSRVHRLFRID